MLPLSLLIIPPSQDHMSRLVNGLNISLCRQPAPHRQDLFLATEAVRLMLQGRIGHHGHQVGHIHVGRLGHNLDVTQLEPQTSNCFSGQAIRRQPAAHDLVPKNLIPLQVNRFVLNQVQKPGGKCILISHSSISRALWCLRGPGYIHCGYNRDGYN